MDGIHSTTLAKPSPGVSQRAPKDRHRIIDSARIPVQDLLRHECPPVHFVGNARGDSPPAFVGHVDVSGMPFGGLTSRERERGD